MHIINISDLSDSREMLESKSPIAIKVFIYFLLLIVLIGFIWISVCKIEIATKASGIIRPEKNISIIRNRYTGIIDSLQYKDGDVVSKGDLLYTINSDSINIEIEQIERELTVIKSKLDNSQLLKKSILSEHNFFEENELEYYGKYIAYEIEKEKLRITLDKSKKEYQDELKLLSSMITKKRIDELESIMKLNNLNYQSFIINKKIEVSSEIKKYEEQITKLNNTLSSLKENIKSCSVLASINGTIQVIQEINSGDFITIGSEIIRIVPNKKKDLIVDVIVSNKDIVGVDIGDNINYRFTALPQSEYGILTGEIKKISQDITSDINIKGAYIIEGSLNNYNITNKDGEDIDLMSGMFCEVRIITGEEKILDYLLKNWTLNCEMASPVYIFVFSNFCKFISKR